MKVEREKWVVAPWREAAVFGQLANAWEDDEPNMGITKHRKLLSLLEQPSSALWEGDLPIGVVLNPPDRDLSTSHLSNSLVLSLFFLRKDVKQNGYILCHFPCLDFLAWKCKKQDYVSKSSTEVEYHVMSTACSEIVWLRGLLEKFGFPQTTCTSFHANNTSAIQIATNLVFYEHTKHIEVDCHSIRDTLESRVISLSHISSDLQGVDVFTKALTQQQHQFLVSKLLLVDLPVSI